MTTEEIKITEKDDDVFGGSVITHPAFGQISFSRTQGCPGKLYGSNLDNHETFITLTINRSELQHNLSKDWFLPKEKLIEVCLSAAQFAELITTMNMSAGVPCTITRFLKENVPGIPFETKTESDRIEESFNKNMSSVVKKLKEYEDAVEKILEKKTLGKEDKNIIKHILFSARRFFTDSAPFAAKSLVEAKEKVVTSAKLEIEAFMSSAIASVGLQQLRKNKELESKEVDLLE